MVSWLLVVVFFCGVALARSALALPWEAVLVLLNAGLPFLAGAA